MTVARYLEWEERQELRHEFDGVSTRAMTGGTAAHAAIQRNLLFLLTGALRGKSCQPFGSELKVQTPTGIRYPDAFVVCSPIAPAARIVTDPVILFEVVSPSSVAIDFVIKNAEYRAMPSVRRYVVLQQSKAAAAVFSRRGDDWLTDLVAGDGAHLELPEIGLRIPLADIYAGLELEAEPGDRASDDA